jgi:hypothetical protein
MGQSQAAHLCRRNLHFGKHVEGPPQGSDNRFSRHRVAPDRLPSAVLRPAAQLRRGPAYGPHTIGDTLLANRPRAQSGIAGPPAEACRSYASGRATRRCVCPPEIPLSIEMEKSSATVLAKCDTAALLYNNPKLSNRRECHPLHGKVLLCSSVCSPPSASCFR